MVTLMWWELSLLIIFGFPVISGILFILYFYFKLTVYLLKQLFDDLVEK